jgi:hypothetical protein
MRTKYIAMIGFVAGMAGTVLMYETRADWRGFGAPADTRIVAHDISTASAGNPAAEEKAAECRS